MQSTKTQKQVVAYYEQAEIDYKLLWHLKKQLAMHFGFWDKGTHTLRQALENENRILADMARVTTADHVLDAGCGVGGSSLYLARTVGCHVTGISLVNKQVAAAQRSAEQQGLAKLATFQTADFTETPFGDNTFDVVWAIESVCHADSKKHFLAEAYRVLKPGGRLVVADGFASKSGFNDNEQTVMNAWLHGWGVDSLDTIAQFSQAAETVGFTSVESIDQTRQVMPSSVRLYRYSFLAFPYDWLSRSLGWRNDVNKRNVIAARYQYRALRRQLWQYATVCAVKPQP